MTWRSCLTITMVMNESMEKKRCLVVVQKNFHSFAVFLGEALRKKGYEVTIANDIYPANIIGAILGKLRIPLILKTTFRRYVATHLRDTRYDVAIIIRGRGVSRLLIKKMTETIPRIVGYNWDTFDFNPTPLSWFRDVNKYYTFDYADADKYRLPVVELFSAFPVAGGPKEVKYNVSAVGKNHPGRLKYIHRVLSILGPKAAYISLYDQNVFYMLFNFVNSPVLYIKYHKYIRLRPLTNADYLDAIGGAEFTIDYANNDQTGITMRCYEAISMQTKLITNNSYVAKSSYFDESNTVVFVEGESDEALVGAYSECLKATSSGRGRDTNAFVDDLLR